MLIYFLVNKYTVFGEGMALGYVLWTNVVMSLPFAT